MNACLRSSSSLSFVVCASALFVLPVVGCGRVPGQFEILNDQIPTPAAAGGCTIPVAPDMYEGEGTLDVGIVRSGFASAYYFFPLIENNLTGTGMASDPNQIQVTGFDVDISTIGPTTAAVAQVLGNVDPALLHFQVPWSGGVKSGGGMLSASVAAVPVALAMQLASAGGLGRSPDLTLNLQIQARGSTNSGRTLVSDPFNFPLQVCNGCLVGTVAPCPYSPTNMGNSCNPAQDEVVDCCTDNGNLICPATSGIAP